MKFMTWLTRNTPSVADSAPHWKPTGHADVTPMTADQVAAHEAELCDSGSYKLDALIELEPMFVLIDYCDSKGAKSRRRITFRHLSIASSGVLLRATCHERKAARSFRTDRIEWFLDDDGVATRCDDFFRDIMDIDLAALRRVGAATQADPNLVMARTIRDKLRPELSLLVAAARCDHDFHPEELDVIMRYAEDRTLDMIDDGKIPRGVQVAALDHLGQIIAKMRPTREALPGYIATVAERGAGTAISHALRQVVHADGAVLLDEVEFLEDLEAMAVHNNERVHGPEPYD